MNETVKTMLHRRSVRAFKPEMPEQAALETILQCALYAPSAMNQQNWHFTVIKEGDLMARMNQVICRKLPEAAKERMTARNHGNPDFSVFYFAPVVVMVSAEATDGNGVVNGALATQNICLAAESLGLGSCIIGMAAMLFEAPEGDAFLKELKIPEGYKPLHTVSLGFKDMEADAPDRVTGKVTVID